MLELFAGLDRDGFAKLFVQEDGRTVNVDHDRWLAILKDAGVLRVGYMVRVDLKIDDEDREPVVFVLK